MIFMRQPLVFILTILRMLVFQIHKSWKHAISFTDAQNKVRKGHKEAIEANNNINREENERIVLQDKFTAIGIAAGYVNLTASLLGYETGCCSCMMNHERVQEDANFGTIFKDGCWF